MTNHVTARPEDRFAGPLDGVPSEYLHAQCGGRTEMPVEIIRSYLANPTIYNDESFCCGCGQYVNTRKLVWVDTGQTLHEYNEDLVRDFRAKRASRNSR
jgi:hypothetical protein